MIADGGVPGADALRALLGLQTQLEGAVTDKEWSAAAGMIVKKLLLSAGQTPDSLAIIKAAVGEEIFIAQLKSLTHHQARQLARRLDKRVPDFEVSTASAAVAHARKLLSAVTLPEPLPEPRQEIEPPPPPLPDPVSHDVPPPPAENEAAPEEAEADATEETTEEKKDPWARPSVSLSDGPEAEKETTDTDSSPPPPPAGSSYFGRRSFRT
ncbi:hypothetical protein HNE_1299 [Hyphomonas neptunium ATCC 15444]|uniref:Uncharacterized protein n=2 Tax=Hyphomonas TaxID=85 RepID=Q0C2M6_HYPNA|nr:MULTISPECIES: hypothetical protein [Hyphomonas]ABI78038.1 hypothetical protein HNE_1299 [Hyphomonas neptunium ATCC 15444]KCZ95750.1 hypothetical protein HHI_03227 [Hyphomonas hirschiana VP5]